MVLFKHPSVYTCFSSCTARAARYLSTEVHIYQPTYICMYLRLSRFGIQVVAILVLSFLSPYAALSLGCFIVSIGVRILG